jgi:hypothetical protein
MCGVGLYEKGEDG